MVPARRWQDGQEGIYSSIEGFGKERDRWGGGGGFANIEKELLSLFTRNKAFTFFCPFVF